jgi:hypothetical protein
MAFRVRFMKGEVQVGGNPWPTKESAVAHAKDNFLIVKKQYGATSVVVIDEDTGAEVFRWTGGSVAQRS